jgi:enoyl-CoA hydratase/carnithine racemase
MSIIRDLNKGVLTLQLDRPEKLNALSCAMYRQLDRELAAAEEDPEVKVVVLKGQGSSFTSGNDLQDFLTQGSINEAHPAVAFLFQMTRFPKPIIADVHGHAVGIGTTLLLHCDLVVADPQTRFQLPFIHLALVPEFASSYLLPRNIGPQRAAELLMLGEPFSAQQAYQWGLVNRVAEHEEREGLVQEWACKLTKLPEQALRQTKALLRHDAEPIQQTIRKELAVFSDCLKAEESQQRIAQLISR